MVDFNLDIESKAYEDDGFKDAVDWLEIVKQKDETIRKEKYLLEKAECEVDCEREKVRELKSDLEEVKVKNREIVKQKDEVIADCKVHYEREKVKELKRDLEKVNMKYMDAKDEIRRVRKREEQFGEKELAYKKEEKSKRARIENEYRDEVVRLRKRVQWFSQN